MLKQARKMPSTWVKDNDFLPLHGEENELERIDFFKTKANDEKLLAKLYKTLGSAVDLAMIFKTQDDNCRKYHEFMEDVFSEVMEMLWILFPTWSTWSWPNSGMMGISR